MYDLKRIFSRKALIILLLISPVVIITLFSAIVMPMLYTAKGLHFKLALCDEDGSAPVQEFITQLVNSQALSELVTVYPVPTLDVGTTLVQNGDVSVFVHIPTGFFEKMRAGSQVEVSIISTAAHALESELITMTLESSLSAVGKSQNLIESAKGILTQKGVSQRDAEGFLNNSTSIAIKEFMSRRTVLGKNGTISPMGEYMPVEYYLSAVFSLFAALAVLPLIHYTAVDANGALLRRGLVSGQGGVRFFIVRIVAGILLVFLVQLMLFPTSALLRMGGSLLGGSYSTNITLTLIAILLSSFCYSILAIVIGTWLPTEPTAIWTGFFLALLMAVSGGTLIPFGALPNWMASIGKSLPLRWSMRMLSSSLFNYERGLFFQEAGKMVVACLILLPVGFFGLHKRGRGI